MFIWLIPDLLVQALPVDNLYKDKTEKKKTLIFKSFGNLPRTNRSSNCGIKSIVKEMHDWCCSLT